MLLTKLRFSVLLATLALAGCAVPASGEAELNVAVPPPPARVEVVGVAPFPGAVWIRGHWIRRGDDWVWIKGYWARRPVPYARWIPGHWVLRGWGWHRHWHWVPGHWREW